MNDFFCPFHLGFIEKEQPTCPVCGKSQDVDHQLYVLPPRTILQNNYYIGTVIAQGGFGITYRGYHPGLDAKLAIKEFYPAQYASRDTGNSKILPHTSQKQQELFRYGFEKFVDEARKLYQLQELQHSNIVKVHNIFQENATAYIVMELLEGPTLESYVQKNGKLPIESAWKWLEPVADALERIHEQILHRDIKPENIILHQEKRPVLIDFGAAKHTIGQQSQNLNAIVSAGYSPPEQYASNTRQDRYTDVYAFTASLVYCITGKTPPDSVSRRMSNSDPLEEQLADVPMLSPVLKDVICQGMNIDADTRFQTMTAFRKAVNHAIKGASPGPSPEDPPEKEKKQHSPSFPYKWIALATTLIAVIAVVAVLMSDSEELPVGKCFGWEQKNTEQQDRPKPAPYYCQKSPLITGSFENGAEAAFTVTIQQDGSIHIQTEVYHKDKNFLEAAKAVMKEWRFLPVRTKGKNETSSGHFLGIYANKDIVFLPN